MVDAYSRVAFQEEKDKKHQEMLQRKLEAQKLLDQEEAALNATKTAATPKITQYQIQVRRFLVYLFFHPVRFISWLCLLNIF